jgi:hypothetical protein
MRILAAAAALMLLYAPAWAGGPASPGGAGSRPGTSFTVPNTGPGSPSFNAYLQSHAGLRQFNPSPTTVPNTGPGSASFERYLQSHSGLSQFNPK